MAEASLDFAIARSSMAILSFRWSSWSMFFLNKQLMCWRIRLERCALIPPLVEVFSVSYGRRRRTAPAKVAFGDGGKSARLCASSLSPAPPSQFICMRSFRRVLELLAGRRRWIKTKNTPMHQGESAWLPLCVVLVINDNLYGLMFVLRFYCRCVHKFCLISICWSQY